ncbi:MAG: twin-arginine translocase subunit TatC [bacterium]
MDDTKLTLVAHLEELRNRGIKSFVFVFLVSLVLYAFIDALLPALIKPIGKVVFISPQEAFVTNIKIALFGGLFLSSPFLLYQVWKFISVGLKPGEKKYAAIFGPISLLFFILGSSFAYFVIIPIGMKFLLGFETGVVTPMITISNYVSFIVTLIFAFGIVFQLPLAMLFLTKTGLIAPGFLSKKRKHAIVLIFITAAILTPPDVITQCLMAVPLIFLYEMGIIFSKFARKDKALIDEQVT